jgi:hypothetical protein
VFLLDVVALLTLGVMVARLMAATPLARTAAPAPEEL